MPNVIEELRELSKKLDTREIRFCDIYIKNGGNGADAARKAFGIKNNGSAWTTAWKILRRVEVQEYIGDFRAAVAEHSGVTFGRLVDKGVQHLEAKTVRFDGKKAKIVDDARVQLESAKYLKDLCGLGATSEDKDVKVMNLVNIYLPERDGRD